MANKAKYFNTKNKYKMLKQNKKLRELRLARRRASEKAKRESVV